MMKRQISMRKGCIEETANWILLNNKYMQSSSYRSIYGQIQSCVDRVIKHANLYWELNYSGTAGFTVFFIPEQDDYGTIEILVDPCVSQDRDYIYIEVI